MRSLLPLSAAAARRGIAAVACSLLTLTTACDFILGVPSVKEVRVALSPSDTIPARQAGQAIATVLGDKDKVLTNSTKITVGFSSSNPAVATVDPGSGAITAISEGTTIITATSRGKRGDATLRVTPELVTRVDVQPVTLFLGGRVAVQITPRGIQGNDLGKRPVTVTSGNTNVVAVETDNTTTGVFVRGVTVGATSIQGTVQGIGFNLPITVQPVPVAKVEGVLQKPNNVLIEGESSQIAVKLFAADGSQLSAAGQTVVYNSNNQSIAIVNGQTGLVTAVREGSTSIDIGVAGSTARGTVGITVLPIPTKQVQISNRAPFIRLTSNGSGVQSNRVAFAFDSLGRQIGNRVISYRSTDPSVFTVSALGTVTGQRLGSARLIASADNGAVADTIQLTVTEVPIVAVTVRPSTATIDPGQSQQFTVTLTDSLGVTVSGRPITWQSSNPVGIPVNGAGVATGVTNAGGTATIQATVDVVPGLPGQIAGQAQILVRPIPIATIDVQPTTVTISLRTSNGTTVAITPRDAAGNALVGRSGSISVTSDNPSVATGDAAGTIRAFTAGTARITFQAFDSNLQPQGVPTTITVTVTQ